MSFIATHLQRLTQSLRKPPAAVGDPESERASPESTVQASDNKHTCDEPTAEELGFDNVSEDDDGDTAPRYDFRPGDEVEG